MSFVLTDSGSGGPPLASEAALHSTFFRVRGAGRGETGTGPSQYVTRSLGIAPGRLPVPEIKSRQGSLSHREL